ncbi:MAG: putative Flagellin, Flp1-like, domain [Bacillales bacterium]|jgi:hypothetical protein|nr:putative Flagellin, Flp1-like, domain [Bacillales bacterium]
MRNFLFKNYCNSRKWFSTLIKDERGETNVVAMILIIVIVIGLVLIFKDRLSALIGNLFDKIDSRTETL